jgi:maleylacetoacetate isomerase
MIKLYTFFRSSAAFRARIALNLKGLAYEASFVHLRKGEQRSPAYVALNPEGLVPALQIDGLTLSQSLAIIEYLDETHPDPPLLPKDPIARAQARALAHIIACDIHPLNNIGTLRYLKHEMHQEQSAIDAWYHHWVIAGFEAYEALAHPGPYSCGGDVTIADLCLVPQVFNARRLKVPLDKFPKIVGIDAACLKLPAFDHARPENQPDAE